MKTFAILGHPVGHSMSPKLHNAVFAEMGLEDRQYDYCDTPPEELEGVMKALKEGKWAGFSVTIPHKQAVIPAMDEVSPRAQSVGAVNTVLLREDGTVFGDNTDYLGFETSLEEVGVFEAGMRSALVLGSGGAARAIISVLVDHGFQVTVASRSPEKCGQLVEDFGIQVSSYADLDANGDFQLIVNTTPVGMHPKEGVSVLEDSAWFRAARVYVDIIYNPKITRFLELAQEAGAKIVTGDRMFLWQAVAQAKYFCGVEEVPDQVIKVMEKITCK